MLTVSPATLKRLIKREEIPVVRVSARRIAFRPEDVTAYLAQRQTEGAKDGA